MRNGGSGTVWYGMHFYPGVAEYRPPKEQPFRVFLNETTIREMDPSFAGKPVFVMHVDDVTDDMEVLKREADGWVLESFYNAADGKHWVKFITVSERAERAIKQGMRLSNAYEPKAYAGGGMWNGVDYEREVKAGEYEHLAIVPNPRYEESVILTPEEFKRYNADHIAKLERLKNHKEPEPMKLDFWTRKKVENAPDLESYVVLLPKSKREVTILQLVNEAEEHASASAHAHPMHLVDMGDGTKMTVKDMCDKYNCMKDELESLKGEKGEGEPGEGKEKENAEETVEEKKDGEKVDRGGDKSVKEENGEDGKTDFGGTRGEKDDGEKTKNAAEAAAKAAKKAQDAAKAAALKNAGPHKPAPEQAAHVEWSDDQVARGKARYGSGR